MAVARRQVQLVRRASLEFCFTVAQLESLMQAVGIAHAPSTVVAVISRVLDVENLSPLFARLQQAMAPEQTEALQKAIGHLHVFAATAAAAAALDSDG
jgi:hypothetical protein